MSLGDEREPVGAASHIADGKHFYNFEYTLAATN
jgi:hypothetical protein